MIFVRKGLLALCLASRAWPIMLVMGPRLLQDSRSTIILHQLILQQEPATAFSGFADQIYRS